MSSQIYPTVSIVVPVFNGEDDLSDLLECLCAQSYPPDRIELIVVDNGSTDRTAEILQSIKNDRGRQSLPFSLRWLSSVEVQSSYWARNCGIKVSAGEIIAFTDVDCRPHSNWLERLVQPFADLTVGIVAGAVVSLPAGSLLEEYATKKELLSQRHTLDHEYCPYGQTANLAVRRDLLEKCGLFRPYLTSGGDADFCWRVQKESNSKLTYAEDAVVRHKHRDSLVGLFGQFRKYGEGARCLEELYNSHWHQCSTKVGSLRAIVSWLFKEVPLTLLRLAPGRAKALDLLYTPLEMFTAFAKDTGYQRYKCPEQMKFIERLE